MDIFQIILIWFVGSFVFNLLHFHGDGKLIYVPKLLSKWPRIWMWAFWAMAALAASRVDLPQGAGLHVLLSCWACGQTYSIWVRHGERVQRRAQSEDVGGLI